MPDNINQHLGMDVSDALAAIDRLNIKFGSFGQRLETNVLQLHAWNAKAESTVTLLNRMATAASAASSAFSAIRSPADDLLIGKVSRGGQTTGLRGDDAARQMDTWIAGCQKAGGAVAATETALKNLGKTGTATGKSLTLSWQTFARIAETQALIRGFNMVRNAIEDSYASYLKFSKQVGEIAAINPERAFAQITDNVRQMSDAFNQPLSRVAEAQYQTISDQFVAQADVANIATAANKLAKAGAQDMAASVQLLTGALNAYGETSDSAGLRAAEFFETIKLGRLRAEELGTALGRIQAVGHELGVSMEELNASLVSITIGGVKASEAATQMRGILSSLLKPSDELKRGFKAIGVESGPAAVATFGLQGALDALAKSVDFNKTKMAAMIPNIRAMGGDFRLVGSGAKAFKEAMDVQSKLDSGSLDKPWQQFIETDAEKLTKELNKLSNFFTVEFGSRLVAQLNSVVQVLGGGDGILGALRVLTGELPRDVAVIGGLVAAFAGVKAAITATRTELSLLNFSTVGRGLASGAGILAAIEAAKIAGSTAGSRYADSLQAPQQAIQDAANREYDVQKIKNAAALRLTENQTTEQFRLLRQLVAKNSVEYLRDADHFKNSAKEIEKSAATSFDRVFAARQKLTQQLFSASETAAKNASNVPDTIAAITQSLADRRIKREIETGGGDAFVSYNKQLGHAADEYERLQSTAKDDREQKLADAAWARVQAYRELTIASARLRGDEYAAQQAARLDDQLDRRKIEALRQYQTVQKQVAQETAERARQSVVHTDELEKLRLRIANEYKSTVKDSSGGYIGKDRETYKKDLRQAEIDTARFNELVRKYGGEDFARPYMGDSRAFEAMAREAEQSYVYLQNIEATPKALANLNNQVQNSVASMRLEIPALVRLEGIVGASINEIGVQGVIDKGLEQYKAMQAKTQAAAADENNRAIGRKEFAQGLAGFQAEFNQPKTSWLGLGAASDSAEQRKVVALLNTMKELAQQTQVTKEEALAMHTALASIEFDKVFPSNTQAGVAAQALQTMQQGIYKMIGNNADQTAAEMTSADAIKNALDSIQTKQELVTKASEEAANAARQFTTAWQNAAAVDLSGLSNQVGSVAAAAGTFYSQLTAVNAGRNPNVNSGGSVTTNTMGDVSITINDSGSPQATAREVQRILQRENRRGLN
jgi:TP901 family phage tail tape measure protein